jgi:hypothetical protein
VRVWNSTGSVARISERGSRSNARRSPLSVAIEKCPYAANRESGCLLRMVIGVAHWRPKGTPDTVGGGPPDFGSTAVALGIGFRLRGLPVRRRIGDGGRP